MVQNSPAITQSSRTENRLSQDDDRRTHNVEFIPLVGQRAWWGAIIAGVVATLALQTLLSVLGMAIGLSIFDPEAGESARGVGIGAGIWWALTSFISLFFGGWMAGRFTGLPRTLDGALHGMLVWGLVTVLTIWLVTSAASGLVGGTMGALQSGASQASNNPSVQDNMKQMAGQVAGAVGGGQVDPAGGMIDWNPVRTDVQQFVTQNAASLGGRDPKQATDEIMQSVQTNVEQGRFEKPEDREKVVTAITGMGLERQQVDQQLRTWEQTTQRQYQQAQQKWVQQKGDLRETAGEATDSMAGASWWTFIGLLLGCLAATIGGSIGVATTTNPVKVDTASH